MSLTIQLTLLGVQLLVLALMAVSGYYLRKYIRRIDHNTRFRRYIAGDEQFDDEGKLDQITEMHDDLVESLQHVKQQNDHIIEAVESLDGVTVNEPSASFEVTHDD